MGNLTQLKEAAFNASVEHNVILNLSSLIKLSILDRAYDISDLVVELKHISASHVINEDLNIYPMFLALSRHQGTPISAANWTFANSTGSFTEIFQFFDQIDRQTTAGEIFEKRGRILH